MDADGRVHMDIEAELDTELGQFLYPRGGAIPEAKIATLVEGASTERLDEHAFDEIPRSQVREGLIKPQKQDGIHARAGQQPQTLRGGRQQPGSALGPQD